jgi:hypothetical protein
MQNNLKAKKGLGMWVILLSIVQRLACDLIIYSQIKAFAGRWGHRVHIEWQRPVSGVHSIMMEKLAQVGEVGGVHAHPLSLYLPSRTKLQCTRQLRGGDAIPLFHLYPLCTLWLGVSMTLPTMSSPVPLISATNIVSIMSLISMTYLSPLLMTPHEKNENNSSPVSTTWVTNHFH